MPEVIKMEYDLMEAMSKIFDQGAQTLNETNAEVQKLATTLEDGALLGKAGDSFFDVLQSKLGPSIQKMERKFLELKRDIDGAVRDMREADQTSKAQF